jgi:hypothetical protein
MLILNKFLFVQKILNFQVFFFFIYDMNFKIENKKSLIKNLNYVKKNY